MEQGLSIKEVERIATEAANGVSPDLKVAGVVFGSADGAYVEILIAITGCRVDECQIAISAFRNVGVERLRRDIADKLQQHLTSHDT